MKTILEVIQLGELYLKKRAIVRPRREAEDLLSKALSLSRLDIYLNYARPLTEEELMLCRALFQRRGKGEPLFYIVGEMPFHKIRVQVTPAVLIPRPETELLVEKMVATLERENRVGKTLVDMCSGSGCIGIALKKQFPELHVILTDISSEALKVAQENALYNQVEVEIRQGDLFAALEDRPVHYFVSNPPYIATEELPQLCHEVREYEPALALCGGAKGLEFYQRIADKLDHYLLEKGWLEIGYAQKEFLEKIFFSYAPHFEKDYAEHDRFLLLNRNL